MVDEQPPPRDAARECRDDEWLIDGFGQRLRLQTLERRGQRQRERERRKRQVPRDVEHPRRPARINRVNGRHAARRQPAGARSHEDE